MRRVLLPLLLVLAACADESWWQQPDGAAPASEASPWPTGDFSTSTNTKLDGRICGEAEFNIARSIADMVIVLDRSNSMAEGTPPLWNTCRNTIYDVTSTMDGNIWFGLFTFPNSVGLTACGPFMMLAMCLAPSVPVVGVAAGTSGAIKSALTTMGVCGGTPTAATLTAAKQYLAKLSPNNHPKYILLVTDGGPNCNTALDPTTCTCVMPGQCSGDGQNCLDDVATLKVLDDLCAAGIKTYVVGLGGAQNFTAVLQAMAQHGCTQQPYTPTDPAAIKKAFQDISGAVVTCSFEIDCSKIENSGLVNFYFDGKPVPKSTSHTGGWDWTTECKGQTGKGVVEFYGADCTAIKDGTVKTVSGKFGCQTIEID
jgi:hypothetical protein